MILKNKHMQGIYHAENLFNKPLVEASRLSGILSGAVERRRILISGRFWPLCPSQLHLCQHVLEPWFGF